jgi:hypothetical protein
MSDARALATEIRRLHDEAQQLDEIELIKVLVLEETLLNGFTKVGEEIVMCMKLFEVFKKTLSQIEGIWI